MFGSLRIFFSFFFSLLSLFYVDSSNLIAFHRSEGKTFPRGRKYGMRDNPQIDLILTLIISSSQFLFTELDCLLEREKRGEKEKNRGKEERGEEKDCWEVSYGYGVCLLICLQFFEAKMYLQGNLATRLSFLNYILWVFQWKRQVSKYQQAVNLSSSSSSSSPSPFSLSSIMHIINKCSSEIDKTLPKLFFQIGPEARLHILDTFSKYSETQKGYPEVRDVIKRAMESWHGTAISWYCYCYGRLISLSLSFSCDLFDDEWSQAPWRRLNYLNYLQLYVFKMVEEVDFSAVIFPSRKPDGHQSSSSSSLLSSSSSASTLKTKGFFESNPKLEMAELVYQLWSSFFKESFYSHNIWLCRAAQFSLETAIRKFNDPQSSNGMKHIVLRMVIEICLIVVTQVQYLDCYDLVEFLHQKLVLDFREQLQKMGAVTPHEALTFLGSVMWGMHFRCLTDGSSLEETWADVFGTQFEEREEKDVEEMVGKVESLLREFTVMGLNRGNSYMLDSHEGRVATQFLCLLLMRMGGIHYVLKFSPSLSV